MDVYQEVLIPIWGAVALLLFAYFLLKWLLFKSPVPPNARERRRFMGVVRHRPRDDDSYRFYPVPLDYFDATPKFQDYGQSTASQAVPVHYRPNLSDDHYGLRRNEGLQVDEYFSIPKAVAATRPARPTGISDDQAHPFRGFGRSDFTPPNKLLRLALELKMQEEALTEALKQRGRAGYTPLLIACWDCDVARIGELLKFGADACEKTDEGETGLLLSTYRMAKGRRPWNPRCLELLIENGCPINAVTKANNTALHMAVKAGHRPITEWLLAHGASVHIANSKGWRPMAIASVNGRQDILELLWEDCAESGKGSDEERFEEEPSSVYYSAKSRTT